jgi:hypothetical protein
MKNPFTRFRWEKDKDMDTNQTEEEHLEDEEESVATQPAPQAAVAEEGQPVNEQAVPEAQESEKKSVDEVAAEEVAPAPAPEVLTGPDASFNCVPCHGSGLQDQYNVCPGCNGTGKV